MVCPTRLSKEFKTSLVDTFGVTEHVTNPTTNEREYNVAFWKNGMENRSVTLHGHPLKWIYFASEVPNFFLHDNQQASHIHGLDQLKAIGANIPTVSGTPAVKTKFYGLPAWIFVNIMSSPIVVTARHYHFKPVLLLRNVLLRRNKIENHFEVNSIDQGRKTCIHLVGFHRVEAGTNNNEFLALTGENGALASITGNLNH